MAQRLHQWSRSRFGRGLLGVLAALPILTIAWTGGVVVTTADRLAVMQAAGASLDALGEVVWAPLVVISVLALIAALLLQLVLGGFFVAHAAAHPQLSPARRAGWLAAILAGGALVGPVYWYCLIWRPEPPRWAELRGLLRRPAV